MAVSDLLFMSPQARQQQPAAKPPEPPAPTPVVDFLNSLFGQQQQQPTEQTTKFSEDRLSANANPQQNREMPVRDSVVNTLQNVPQVDPISILTSEFMQQFNPLTPNEGITASLFAPGASSISQLPGSSVSEQLSAVGAGKQAKEQPAEPAPQKTQAQLVPENLPDLQIMGSRSEASPASPRRARGEEGVAEGEAATPSSQQPQEEVSQDVRDRANRIKQVLQARDQAQKSALRSFALNLMQPVLPGNEMGLLAHSLGASEAARAQTIAQAQELRQQTQEQERTAVTAQQEAALTQSQIELNRARAVGELTGGDSKEKAQNELLQQLHTPEARAAATELIDSISDTDQLTLEPGQTLGTVAGERIEDIKRLDRQALARQGNLTPDYITQDAISAAAQDPDSERALLYAVRNNPTLQAQLRARIEEMRSAAAGRTEGSTETVVPRSQ